MEGDGHGKRMRLIAGRGTLFLPQFLPPLLHFEIFLHGAKIAGFVPC